MNQYTAVILTYKINVLYVYLKCVFGTISLILYVNSSSVLILHNIYSEITQKKRYKVMNQYTVNP